MDTYRFNWRAELASEGRYFGRWYGNEMTDIVLHVFLPCHGRRLSQLEPHLRCLIVHESSKCRRKLSSSA